jgi:hypothetical protein
MALIPVENVGETGIVKDINPWQLPPNAWSDGNNVRVEHGAIVKSPGYAEVLATCPVTPYHIIQLKYGSTAYWIIASLTKIYVHNGTIWTNITRQTTGSDVDYNATADEGWTSTVIGGVLVMANGFDQPQFWALASGVPSVATKMDNLTYWAAGAGATYYPVSVRAFRSFLIALNIDEGGTPVPQKVKWSTEAATQLVPSSWDESSAIVDAGEYQLADTKGAILDGLPLGDTFMIYKDDSIYSMTYVGTPFIFAFRQLSPSVGALAKNCVAEFDGGHFILGNGDVYINDGQRVKSILPHKIRDYIFSVIDGANFVRSFVVADYGNTEMWACFPTPESPSNQCDKAVVWNWTSNAFTIRDLPDLAHIGYGTVDDPNAFTTWAAAIPTWSSALGTWTSTWSQSENVLVMASPTDTKLYRNASGNKEAATDMTSFISRTGIAMSAQGQNDQSIVKRIKAIWPKMEVSGSGNTVNVYVGTQNSTEEAVSWSSAVAFNPDTQSKVSVRKSGKLYGVKFESTGDFNWRLDGYEIELDDAGRRGSRMST